MRICWTSQPSYALKDLGIHRGTWAGHLFDIVTQENHEAEVGLTGWRDVSAEVVKEVEEL